MPANDGERQVQGDDGGVFRRLARRSRRGGAALLVAGVAVLLVALLSPKGILTVLAALVALTAIGIGAVLVARAVLWTGMSTAAFPGGYGAAAVLGASTPLSPARPGAPLRRRLGAAVVPVRVEGGPQPGGGALLIHARADGITLVGGDQVQLWRATRRGPEPLTADRPSAEPPTAEPPTAEPPTAERPNAGPPAVEPPPADGAAMARGRFVLRRDSDGAVFVGTTRLSDVL